MRLYISMQERCTIAQLQHNPKFLSGTSKDAIVLRFLQLHHDDIPQLGRCNGSSPASAHCGAENNGLGRVRSHPLAELMQRRPGRLVLESLPLANGKMRLPLWTDIP